jgi:hypothetical protein
MAEEAAPAPVAADVAPAAAEVAAATATAPPNEPPAQAATYAPAVGYAPVQPMSAPVRNNGLALVLEVVPGLFGFFGIGWLVGGFTSTGLFLLIGGIIWLVVGSFLSILTLGAGFFCMAVINLIVVIVSTLMLNNRLKAAS